ncbi:MAG TPA: hypothetical protein VFE82_10870 [Ramlibacter sp.]|uniref:hypothetical protein n=1 Tax=Ramlibacter sp. TaxID=1917967 RepID=UPI002D68350E|nr:hypothetical protein [Ramlibacter sp.]HZY18975.1 hypothetical protein [Ramlibacter sp.]
MIRLRLAAGLLLGLPLGLAFVPADAAPPRPAASSAPARIDSLEVNADAGLLPGSRVDFTLRGSPGGRARVQVLGAGIELALREGAPGLYTGDYTVRRTDRVDAGATLRASIDAGARSVVADYAFPPSFKAHQQAMARAVPQALPAAEPPAQPSAPPQAASSAPLPGPFPAPPVSETSPAPAATSPPSPGADTAPLTLLVLHPTPEAVVDGSEVVVEGRTAPHALVRAEVDAVPPSIGGRMRVARNITRQTLQADADGRFSLTFGPQQVLPGTRFEVDLSATRDGLSTPRQRLVLYQKQG